VLFVESSIERSFKFITKYHLELSRGGRGMEQFVMLMLVISKFEPAERATAELILGWRRRGLTPELEDTWVSL
jgi:hypothetical protein